MRVCLVYDCLFPWTVGGAERWYRNLAERLAADGHEVTYLTLLQWDAAEPPSIPACASSRSSGRGGALRRRRQPARSGRRCASAAGVLRHLLRHGRALRRRAHASFPYFSVLAAGAGAAARPLPARRRLVRGLERATTGASTSGGVGGRVGCARAAALRARAAARLLLLAAARARACASEGLRGEPTRARAALYAGRLEPPRAAAEPRAARRLRRAPHPREARARGRRARSPRARARGLDVRGVIFGDGPERAARARGDRARTGSTGVVEAPGFVDTRGRRRRDAPRAVPAAALAREGYGLVVVEASARGHAGDRRRGRGQRGGRAGRGRA